MKLIVIGNGMVGQRLLERLRTGAAKLDITVLCEESRPAYDRVHLTSYFSGKSAQDLSLVEAGFFDRPGISLKLSETAVAIDRERHTVKTADGLSLEYDRLVLATGSYPFVPQIPGHDRPCCFVYRTIDDLDAIRSASATAKSGVVIGGGLLGLEAAKALKDLGLETHVVEFAPRLMAVQIDDAGGSMLRGRIRGLGVSVHTAKQTTAIADGTERAHCLRFADGSELETDLIVFSAGIRPRDELARVAGLQVGDRGGIVIDDACRTSDPAIFAIGECAFWNGKLYGLVAPGYRMADTVASQLQGGAEARFAGADMSTKLKLMGVDVASIGDAHAMTGGARACVFIDERRQIYKKLVLNEDGTRLLGGILVGSAEEYGTWLQMVQNGLPLPDNPEQLMFAPIDAADGQQPLGLAALPAAVQICSCNNVSKGDLCAAIASGARTFGALKQHTKAASSCGGCAPLVTQVLK
ncbi:MAG TPA: nitrite reductase large subunit NirB, partial [Steroidobacteraceae bacterium]